MSITYEPEFPTMDLGTEFRLREHDQKDIDTFFDYYTNPNVAKYILASTPQSRKEAESEIYYCRNLFHFKRGIYWTIAENTEDNMIGAIGITINNFNHRGELHYDLAESYWNKGITSHAIATCSQYAFNVMGLMRLEAITMPDNVASQQVLLKNNYTHEGLLRNYKYYQQKPVDIEIFAIIPSDLEQ